MKGQNEKQKVGGQKRGLIRRSGEVLDGGKEKVTEEK